ncbi:hypothetical protein WICANDRAFT_61239 [Wickerhamomyces anomalus NRRL Y-366-8]|uniref:DNA topoisomerase n=1 Tax=Wickerhamomyces anomalus (strain ATCC 58044 / CBS 1984 / NCYC 433 / NRRL Y-366-8) TaxID=683960 RepID=A0A1E3P5M1_WICAA|nr:uncharacterized protein WICANDRAFT_61239 [Wickerhamomyces anomalus NRRL Y-366-8]ODQ60673.1 hypothetical protein WICANDRAFT_61239 [Wickerhamomyces anomalus NRRL Y-366-8]
MKILCVAEKNSIGKAVANILGGGRVRTSNSTYKYVKNYEFSFNFPQFGNCNVVMTSVAGHLTGLDFPDNYAWGKCNAGKLFEAPVKFSMSKEQTQIAKNIENLSRGCDRLMIWTDCDREGEYIGKEILDAARKGNPNLTVQNTMRAQFSHLERNHILKAAREPKQLDVNAISAVGTRQELDLRTGAAFTRFLCDVFKRYRDAKMVDLVSYGSCQFPTLGFVVDRYKRVQNFVPEEFWFLDVSVKKDNKTVRFSWKKSRLFDRVAAVVLYENCMKSDRGTITNVKSSPTSKWRPLPLTTVELQKSCSLYFKMSAKESLECAEKLYQAGFLSYPRTETDIYPRAMDLKALIEKQKDDTEWGTYAQGLLNDDKFQTPRAGRHNDEAHPPIHPVNHVNLGPGCTLKANEKKVYEFVVRHFLASCSKDAKGSSTNVEMIWGSETFNASGLHVLETNYLDVYKYQTWKSTNELPKFEMNETVKLNSAELKSGKTSAPNLMTEAELIALMDANGIGTDATIAEHIDKIANRQYITKVTKQRKSFLVPTTLGMGLVDGFEELNLKNSLTKPFLRKSLEDELKQICEGRKPKETVAHEMIELYRESFALSVQHQNVILDAYQHNRRNLGQEVV